MTTPQQQNTSAPEIEKFLSKAEATATDEVQRRLLTAARAENAEAAIEAEFRKIANAILHETA